MKIKTRTLVNRIKPASVPIPGELVETTIEKVGNIRYDFLMRKFENVDWGVVYPDASVNGSLEYSTWGKQWDNNSGEYYASQGYNTIPCNVGGSSNLGVLCTFNPDFSQDLWNGRHFILNYMEYYTPTGALQVTIGNNMPVGKYVFELTHWIGFSDKNANNSRIRIDGNRKRIVKQGTHGVIEGYVFDDNEYYSDNRISTIYRGYVARARIRYAFEVAQGDTTKTFEFGRGKEISFEDLWDCVHINTRSGETQDTAEVWYNGTVSFSAKVYKSA